MARFVTVLSLVLLAADFEPARLERAAPVQLPAMAVGGGEVFLQVQISAAGRVSRVLAVRDTPPYTDLLRAALPQWQFVPAQEEEGPVSSRVLVAGLFRPPTLYTGATLGQPPREVGSPWPEIPYPTSTSTPVYPAEGRGEGVVITEIQVNASGEVGEARVVVSAGGFDAVALDAARQWRFRPAQRNGQPVPAYAYVVFGFREPVVSPPPP